MGQAADELRDAEEIRRDIERTREDMASTLDAIGEKVSPRLQAERQMDRLRRARHRTATVAMAAAGLLFTLLIVLAVAPLRAGR